MNRKDAVLKASSEEFDLCIIGGGITGAGILTHAVQRGWKALLLDKHDFASGTSSRSSKMIHGGLRYLKMFQFGLVREALREREHLLHRYPALVRPLPFIMPSYHSRLDLNLKAFVIRFYGYLGGKSSLPVAKKLTPQQVVASLPGFNMNGLKGGVLYWDGWTNDALLTIAVLKEAADNGAMVLNYAAVQQGFCEQGNIKALQCRDTISGQDFSIRAKVYINATGVWTDEVLQLLTGLTEQVMKPSKGVHVVVANKRLAADCVAIIPSGASDQRYLYSFPWEHDLTVLGNTDTEYHGSANKLTATESDVDYILKAFNQSFPDARLQKQDIISVYTGLRPMLNEGDDKGSYKRSREYRIWWSGSNLVNIAGGKLTSFLSMGEHCLRIAEKRLPTRHTLPEPEWKQTPLAATPLTPGDETLNATIFNGLKTTKAEVVYHTRYLFAQQVEDVLTRRTAVTYAMKLFDEPGVRETARLMANEMGQTKEWVEAQVQAYREHWKEYHPDFITR